MSEYRAGRNVGKVILGLTIVAFGVIFLLGNLNVIQAHHYLRYWPVILIAFGVARLVSPWRSGGQLLGLIVGTVGVLLRCSRSSGRSHGASGTLWPCSSCSSVSTSSGEASGVDFGALSPRDGLRQALALPGTPHHLR